MRGKKKEGTKDNAEKKQVDNTEGKDVPGKQEGC